jgi:6-phosphogluconolactonase
VGSEQRGALSAYAINPETNSLTFLNRKLTLGARPCHISLDKTGGWALVANAVSGNVSVLRIRSDGTLGDVVETVEHYGRSIHTTRQQEPHAHQIVTDSSNRFAFVPDLGVDKIMIYDFDGETGKLEPASPAFASTHPGGGPRHFVMHPSERFAYVINELDSTITVFTFSNGKLDVIQTIGTLPGHFSGSNMAAAIKVHPSGRFVYGSNRGHDSIAMFCVDEMTGKLDKMGYQLTQGATPRDFDLDPTGALLVVCNQDADNVVSFKVDIDDGFLASTGMLVGVSKPSCVRVVSCA